MLYTKCMNAQPAESDGLRICVMRDARIYNRQLKDFEEKYGRPMYDMHLKDLAPSLELKNNYKHGITSWEEYVPIFTKEVLEGRLDLIKQLALDALNKNITLLCTEKEPDNCHRRLLAEKCKQYQPTLEILVR